VEAGKEYTIALQNAEVLVDPNQILYSSEGKVVAWGGVPGLGYQSVAIYIPAGEQSYSSSGYMENIVQVSAGLRHCMALERLDYRKQKEGDQTNTSRGRVYVWGDNHKHEVYTGGVYTEDSFGDTDGDGNYDDKIITGQLADPEIEESAIPIVVRMQNGEALENIVHVGAGADFSWAIDKDNQMWVWGRGEFGALGTGGTDNEYYPVALLIDNMVIREARMVDDQLNPQARFASIQDAIGDPNTISGDILTVYPGTYHEDIALCTDVSNQKQLTIRSVDPNDAAIVENTVIKQVFGSYALNLGDGSSPCEMLIEGITFDASNYYGVKAYNVDLTLRNCRILGVNSSCDGIDSDYGSLLVDGCTIIGGLYGIDLYECSTDVLNSHILDQMNYGIYCYKDYVSGGDYYRGNVNISNSVIYSSQSGYQAGINVESYENDAYLDATLDNVTIVNAFGYSLQKSYYTLTDAQNCIFWAENEGDSSCTKPLYDYSGNWDADDYGITYSWLSNSGLLGTTGQNHNVTYPYAPFVHFYDFADKTTATCNNANSIIVANGSLYTEGDVIEYNNDGMLRTVSNVVSNEVTFTCDPAYGLASTESGKAVTNWGQGTTSLEVDLHLLPDATEIIDTGLTPNPCDPNAIDIDGDSRYLDGDGDEFVDVDRGADEFVLNTPPVIKHSSGESALSLVVNVDENLDLSGFTIEDDAWPGGLGVYTTEWIENPNYTNPGDPNFTGSNVLNTTVNFAEGGEYHLRLKVSESVETNTHSPRGTNWSNYLYESYYDVTILVNQAPVITVVTNELTLDLDDSFTFSPGVIYVSDDDHYYYEELLYAWRQDSGPTVNGEKVWIQGESNILYPTISFPAVGDYVIHLEANDGVYLSFSETITLHVTNLNDAPVISGLGNWTAPLQFSSPGVPDDTKNYILFDRLEISDDKTSSENLQYDWQITLPDGYTNGAEFNDTGTIASSLPTPQFNFSREGVYTVTLTVTDNEVPAKDSIVTFTVSVSMYNQTPVVTASLDGTPPIYVGAHVSVTAVVQDDQLPAGRTLSEMWVLTQGDPNHVGLVDENDLYERDAVFVFTEPGPYTLTFVSVEVLNGEHVLAGYDEVDINVSFAPPTEGPQPEAGTDRTIYYLIDGPTTLTMSGASIAGTYTSFQWSCGNYNVEIQNGTEPDEAVALFKAPGTYTLYLCASDGTNTNYDTVIVNVKNDPSLCVIDSLPYHTSFVWQQGYILGDLNMQKGWEVISGIALVDTEFSGGATCALIYPGSEISKGFNSNGSEDEYIRLEIQPEYNTEVKIGYAGKTIAGVRFVDSGNGNIALQAYSAQGYQAVPNSPIYRYQDYVKIKFNMNYDSGSYTFYSAPSYGQYTAVYNSDLNQYELDPPGASLDYTNVGMYSMPSVSHVTMDSLVISGGFVPNANTSMATFVNTISINSLGYEDVLYDITRPGADTEDEIKGSYEVTGTIWDPWLIKYELMYCPADAGYTDSQLEQLDVWTVFSTGRSCVKDDVLGYWDTSAIPNGSYHFGFRVHRGVIIDINGQQTLLWADERFIVEKEVTRIEEGEVVHTKANAVYSVTGDLKCNTFTHVEDAEIQVPWQGTLPLEFRRIYNNNRRYVQKPLAYGWTHNNQIKLTEDSINTFEPDSGGIMPLGDNNKVAFGYIWVTYPDGSKHLFRHFESLNTSSNEGFIYIAFPDINSGDQVTRTTTLNAAGDDIESFEYVLNTRDGRQFVFQSNYVRPDAEEMTLDAYDSSRSFGNIFGIVEAGIDSISDRYGNTLEFQWFDEDSNPATDEAKALQMVYCQRSSDCIGLVFERFGVSAGTLKNGLYSSVELRLAATASSLLASGSYTAKNRVEFDFASDATYADGYQYSVSKVNYGVDENGVYDTANLKRFTKSYLYDSSHNLRELYDGTDLAKQVNYDEFTRMVTQYEYIEAGNYLRTDYEYNFFDPNENDDEDYQYLQTVNTSYYAVEDDVYDLGKTETISVRNEKGTTIEKYQLFYLADTTVEIADANSLTDDEWELDESIETKVIDLEYTDPANPVMPTLMKETYPDPTGGTSGNVTRITEKEYSESSDLLRQRVYVDADNFVLTSYGYHPLFGIQKSTLTYQGLCHYDANDLVITGNQVSTESIYGDPNGRIDQETGRFVVQERRLKHESDGDTTNSWAITYYTYYDNGRVKTATDPEGVEKEYLYDVNWDLTYEIVRSVGSGQADIITKRSRCNEIGQIILVTTQLGAVTCYNYDQFGRAYRIRSYRDADAITRPDSGTGAFRETTYDGMTPEIETVYGYDEQGRKTYERKSVLGHDVAAKTVTTYTIGGQPKSVGQYECTSESPLTFTLTSRITYHYNSRGQKIAEHIYDATQANGYDDSWTTCRYEGANRLVETIWYDYMRDANPGYDDTDLDAVVTNAAVIKCTMSDYFANGKKKWDKFLEGADEVTDLQKHISYKYDMLDNMVKSTVHMDNIEDNIITRSGYDTTGNVLYTIEPVGNCIFTDYDNFGRTSIAYFAVPAADVVWDGDSLNYANTRAKAIARQCIEYYNNDLTKTVTNYDYDHDQNGKPDKVLSYKKFDYDRMKRLTHVYEAIEQNAQGEITRNADTWYAYADSDAAAFDAGYTDWDICMTDGEGKKTWIMLDESGSQVKVRRPYDDSVDTQKQKNNEEYEFYGDGSLKTKYVWYLSNPSPETYTRTSITCDYDDFGRLTSINYPSPESGTVNYTYSGQGQIEGMSDSRTGYSYTYTYNALGQIESVTDQDNYTTSYTYTADNQKKSIRVFNGSSTEIYSVAYDYDEALGLQKIREPLLGANDLIAGFAYTDNGCRSSQTYYLDGTGTGDTVTVSYAYNADNQLVGYSTTGGVDFEFEQNGNSPVLDGLGRLMGCHESLYSVGNTSGYAYDLRGEMTNASKSNINGFPWSMSYGYDNAGNIDEKIDNEVTETTDYDDCITNDFITGWQVGTNPAVTLDWDPYNGRLTQSDQATLAYQLDGKLKAATNLASNTRIDLKYDPAGNRVYKKTDDGINPAAERKYIIDTVGSLPVILVEIEGSSEVKSYIYAESQVLAQHNGDSTDLLYFYLYDRLGSVRLVIDENAGIMYSYTYDPYGKVLEEDHDAGAPTNAFTFVGQYYDEEISQYCLRARMYDPTAMRFTTRDSSKGDFTEPLALHRYLYCINNPVNRLDLNGMWNDGIRYTLREQGVAGAYTLSDAEIKANYPEVWANSAENWNKTTVWEGHSDFGYHTGDFDYTTPDHDFWMSPFNIVTGTPLHFRPMDGPFGANFLVTLAIYSGDVEFFQATMHFGQDFYSHYNRGYRWVGGEDWDHSLGHANAPDGGHAPDNPYVKDGAAARQRDTASMEADRFTKQKEEIWYLIWDTDTWWKL
jgi:RHS repeat-associated protein